MRSLTAEVAKGHPVLVCFTAYAGDWSPALVAELRALQSAHPELIIFEVSEAKTPICGRMLHALCPGSASKTSTIPQLRTTIPRACLPSMLSAVAS